MRVRSIRRDDLPALMALAGDCGVGLTTLPPHEEVLARRIEASLRAGAAETEASWLFVLEENNAVIGVAGLEGAIGLSEPCYSYRQGVTVRASQQADIFRRLPTLTLGNDLTGASALCTLFLAPAWRSGGHGVLLSRSRLMFIADRPERFSPVLTAEIRGVNDENGSSPFWNALGRHFFHADFARADYLRGTGASSAIAQLMPQQTLFTDFLPASARAVIGQTHPASLGAVRLLKAEGMQHTGYIDLFDGGPILVGSTRNLHTVSHSRVYPVKTGAVSGGELFLLSNRRVADFVALIAPARLLDGVLQLDALTLEQLQLAPHDSVRALALNPC